jgi:hypothetical protein
VAPTGQTPFVVFDLTGKSKYTYNAFLNAIINFPPNQSWNSLQFIFQNPYPPGTTVSVWSLVVTAIVNTIFQPAYINSSAIANDGTLTITVNFNNPPLISGTYAFSFGIGID